MKSNGAQLRKELRQAGASDGEIKQLLPIAARFDLLKSNRTASHTKHSKSGLWLRLARPIAYATSGLAVGAFIVTLSQSALPTSSLYPVQKISDNIAVWAHPQYRATVMMKRAQQVNQLVATHASSKQVLAVLSDYTVEASAYKKLPHADYAAFEFCKTNLQQAAGNASPDVRQAISSSLESLENT